MLDPAGLWENLRKLLLRDGDDLAAVVKEDAAGAGGALIEREDVFHGDAAVLAGKGLSRQSRL
jgi:hypothetical protein